MKKKTVLVETSKQGKQWSIKVTSTSADLRSRLARTLVEICTDFNIQILNATDPFGDTISKRKRKIHKPVMGPAETKDAIDALQDLKQAVLKS